MLAGNVHLVGRHVNAAMRRICGGREGFCNFDAAESEMSKACAVFSFAGGFHFAVLRTYVTWCRANGRSIRGDGRRVDIWRDVF